MMMETYRQINTEETLMRISEWWKGENTERACIAFSIKRNNVIFPNFNVYWNSSEIEPDFEVLADNMIRRAESFIHFGEALPTLPNTWGDRGTPMVLSAFLGGKLKFTPETIWIDPIIEEWDRFELKFNEENIWFKRSFKLFETIVEKSKGRYFPHLPDFGDFMTVFSLLRGVGRLSLDLIENKERILEARDKFLQVWQIYHERFWKLYSLKFPGDCSWLVWAPGKTYMCQCDFSTMISPQMFVEFVVPEIEAMGKYLEYIAWHFDGPEEIKHLDILLELPQVRAIQWVPGAGNPPGGSPQWLPLLKRIQGKGKNVIVTARNETEVKSLIENLSPKGLFICGGFTGKTEEEARAFLKWVAKLSKGSS